MPGFPDKIIINSNTVAGNNKAIEKEFDTLKTLGEELISLGPDVMKEAEPLKAEMKTACSAYDASQADYLQTLRELVAKTAELIDKHVIP